MGLHQTDELILCAPARRAPARVFHTVRDPTRYFPKPSKPPPDRLKIAGEAGSVLAYSAIFLLGAGLVGEAYAFWIRSPQSQLWFIVGLSTLLLGLICALTWLRLPHREVWIEFARERVVIADGFWLPGLFDLREREHRSLREFSHLRVIEAGIEGGGEGSTRPAWLVSLEGPVHYASDTGGVERQRGVELATLDAHRAALKYAARIGTHLGLRILDTERSWS